MPSFSRARIPTTHSIRLAESLQTVNDATTKFGGTVMDLSLSNGDAASTLVDLMGGLDAFSTAVSNYESKMFTSAEQSAMDAAAGYTDMSNALAAVGYAVPATSDQFKAIVNSLDLTTTAGQDAYAAFMSVTDGAAAFYDQAKAISDAATAMSQDLTVRAYVAEGLDAEATLYQLRIDQLDEIAKAEESGLYTTEQITALKIVQEEEWAKAVTDASAQVSDAMQSLIDSSQTALENLLDLQTTLLNKWKSLSTSDSSLSPQAAYEAAQAAFADASKPENYANLPDAIDKLLAASEAYNAHGAAYQSDYQKALDMLAQAGEVTDPTLEKVDKQISLLDAIKTALTDGTLADNSELVNQLGPNSTLQELISAWSDATKNANDSAKLTAASETYGRAYDAFSGEISAAQAAYTAGGSLADYTSSTQSALSTIETAYGTATEAGVTNFTDSSGASHGIGTTDDLSIMITAPLRYRTKEWAATGAQLAYNWDIGDSSAGQPDLQYDVAGFSYTDRKPNGIIDMNDYYALMEMAAGTRALPTYAVGSPFISSDQVAQLHEGEAVIDAQNNAFAQKYGFKVQTSGGNNDAVVAKLVEQIAELKEQNKHQAATVKVLSASFQEVIRLLGGQNKITAEIASKTRLASLQRTA